MHTDHKDALIVLAREFAGIEAKEATMTSVDRLGFHVRLKTTMACAEPGLLSCTNRGTRRKPEKFS